MKLRTSARNRIFGLLTQFGLRISFTRLRQPDAIELLKRRGVPEVWRDSIAEHLDQISELDRRISPIDRELGLAPRINQSGEHSATGRLSKGRLAHPALAVARKLLIASWHMLSRGQVFQPARSTTATASSSRFLAA